MQVGLMWPVGVSVKALLHILGQVEPVLLHRFAPDFLSPFLSYEEVC